MTTTTKATLVGKQKRQQEVSPEDELEAPEFLILLKFLKIIFLVAGPKHLATAA